LIRPSISWTGSHKGDQAAQEILLARHLRVLKPIVHHRLPTYVRSMTDTDDVVQDVLVKTVGRLRYFESRNPMAFLAYLRRRSSTASWMNCVATHGRARRCR